GFRRGRLLALLRRGPAAWWHALRRRLAPAAPGAAEPAPSDADLRDWPAPGAEAGQLAALVGRGVQVFALYTGGAARYFSHPRQFFAGYGAAARSAQVTFAYWRDCDHLFLLPEDRERLLAALSDWLRQRFG